MHEMLLAAALSTGLLTATPQMQAQPGVITTAVTHATWHSTDRPAAAVAPAKKISPQHTIRQPRSATAKLAAAFIGALAGFYVGGHIGAALDNSGGDSPGMAGLMYGAAFGTTAGAVIGWKLAR
jgi:outer membrane lipoprotein SlyB